jgi:23S rRNA-/tRNA-specific pseudouridylate synthase
MRLDQAIASRFPAYSRRRARELIAAGAVLVNQRRVAIASRHVNDHDEIAVVEERPAIPTIASGDDWIAVDKPAGMPTQPARDRRDRSLEELLRLERGEIYLVHRLDTPTSGFVLFATTREAAARFSRLFTDREMGKTYLAVIDGDLHDECRIETPIEGQEALTIVRPIEGAMMEVEIRTGRMHQIRVHLASIGHPVRGDRRYGGSPAPRLMLHAWKLEHPSIGTITAPPPDPFPQL